MLFNIEAINLGGKNILRSYGTALFLIVVVVQLHVTLSHLSIHLSAQVEEMCEKASSRTGLVNLSAQKM